MTELPLDLPFKGARDYLTGADIYDLAVGQALTLWPDAAGRVRLTFHRLARHQCRLVCSGAGLGPERPQGSCAEFVLDGPRRQVAGWLVEGEGAVRRRIPYDEDAIIRATRMEGEEIMAGPGLPNTPIEICVALTKRLHYARQPLTAGRWMFTRLDLHRPLAEADREAGLAVRFRQALGRRLTRSSLLAGGTALGDIYFSVVDA